MLRRKLGKLDIEVPVLGFGCMRLPLAVHGNALAQFDPKIPIDENQVAQMIEYALEQGIDYFDTAYMYHGGKSEELLGRFLPPVRDRVMLTTKLPCRFVQTADDFEKILSTQLMRLQTDYLDFYLMHGLDAASWERMCRLGVMGFIEKIVADGRARHVGFSFHDGTAAFKKIIDAYDWSLCQIQYNYLDEDFQAGREGLAYAAQKGVGVVVMEPLRGGRLVQHIPHDIQTLWDQAPVKRSPVEWALCWVWNHPEVSMVLSGMSTMDQVRENIHFARNARANSLSQEEIDLVGRVAQTYRERLAVSCTACAYCMPCPNGVNIPFNLSLYNDFKLFEPPDLPLAFYNHLMAADQRANNCIQCGECEEKCPQHIAIADTLEEVHKALAR
jgi:predicted aldo/keto reductase-like oxidoreductase